MITGMDWQESREDWDEDDPTRRPSFPTLAAYIYVNHWLAVLIAEKNAACVELNDEGSDEEEIKEKLDNQQKSANARLSGNNDGSASVLVEIYTFMPSLIHRSSCVYFVK